MMFSLCLQPKYSLRRQLLLSFGVTAVISLTVVVVVMAVIFAQVSSDVVRSTDLLTLQVQETMMTSSVHSAERCAGKMENIEGIVQIMAEVVRDRIVGYPNEKGWQTDDHVPFFDMDRQRNVYPLKTKPVPLDWQIKDMININATNLQEHLQERTWAQRKGLVETITTATASYRLQGACDPKETNPRAKTYYANCTSFHNNPITGGKVQPSPTNWPLYEKTGDLGIFLKPLFEAEQSIMTIDVSFMNSGAGSQLSFPGCVVDGTSEPYISNGCDWMERNNPYTGKPFATQKEISRCHPKGQIVPQREYNPLEQAWCQEFALQYKPGTVSWYGPFRSQDTGMMILIVGKAVFDRMTNEFIGCVSTSLRLEELYDFLRATRLSHTEMAIVRYDDRTVLVDTLDAHRDPNIIASNGGGANITVVQTGLISEDMYHELIDQGFNQHTNWTPVLHNGSGVFSAHPVPPLSDADSNNSNYKPLFFVLHYMNQSNEALKEIEALENEISQELNNVSRLCVFIAVVGLSLVFAIVWFVSRGLTRPLAWIEEVAGRIVRPSDDKATTTTATTTTEAGADQQQPSTAAMQFCWVVPTTEISTLVSEFRMMISDFSGLGASTVAEPPMNEVLNEVTWRSDYRDLYKYDSDRRLFSKSNATPPTTDDDSRPSSPPSHAGRRVERFLRSDLALDDIRDEKDQPSPSPMEATSKSQDQFLSKSVVPAPPKRNEGSIFPHAKLRSKRWVHHQNDWSNETTAHRSSLFWWIFILIVLPLLTTNVVICSIVSMHLLHTTIKDSMVSVEHASVDFELEALRTFADLKASFFEMSVQEVARDMHFMNRLAGWLFFDGIKRSGTFTYLEEATEDCKTYPFLQCPFLQSEKATCECQWNDKFTWRPCTNSTSFVARSRQRGFFLTQARDANPQTGDREKVTSYHLFEVDRNASTTLWRNNTIDVPGSERGQNATGHLTSYDRLRVSSAMSVAFVPVYNYAQEANRRLHDMGTFIAFESDGSFTGQYGGCDLGFTIMSFFSAGESEARNRPEICPLNKYGYDPRCRMWYAEAVSRYKTRSLYTYVTPPYTFVSGFAATSATSPLLNPETGTYLGQLLYDFHQDGICRSLEKMTLRLSFVITPEADENGGDTVVRPQPTEDLCEKWESSPIGNYIFQNDTFPVHLNVEERRAFEELVLPSLRSGTPNASSFSRIDQNQIKEDITVFFAPVSMRVLAPVSTSDFARGVNLSSNLVYIVALGRSEKALREPYKKIEKEIHDDIRILGIFYDIFVGFVSILFVVFSYLITVSVVKPILVLLQAVQSINDGKVDDDMPPMSTGSREMYQVYDSFAKLYKIVRMSNVAFFSGQLPSAYSIVCDALKVFRRAKDSKAVGIACNNLGNTLYAMIHQSTMDETIFDEEGCVVTTALQYHDEAILIAKNEFAEAVDEHRKAEYALQLADRYFNRALLLLTDKANESDVPNAKERAFEDIVRARDLDYDVKDFWMDRKLMLKYSDVYFARLIRRLHGLIDHYNEEGLRSLWNPQDLAQEADGFLFTAWNEKNAPLFDMLTNVGRLQQLEGAVIRLDLCSGRPIEAARLAMRMLCEDEYILESSLASAARAIQNLLQQEELSATWSSKTKSSTKADLRKLLRDSKHVSLDLGKCFVFAIEINEKWEGDVLFEKISMNCLQLYDTCFSATDHLGIVAYTTRGDLNVELGAKKYDASRQRTALEMATTSTGDRESPSLPYAMQILVDSEATMEDDSYILLIADGESWEPSIFTKTQLQIERLNQERSTSIHVIVLGVELEEEEIAEGCKVLCSVSKKSAFIEVDESNVDAAFDKVATLITGRCLTVSSFQGLTMEKF